MCQPSACTGRGSDQPDCRQSHHGDIASLRRAAVAVDHDRPFGRHRGVGLAAVADPRVESRTPCRAALPVASMPADRKVIAPPDRVIVAARRVPSVEPDRQESRFLGQQGDEAVLRRRAVVVRRQRRRPGPAGIPRHGHADVVRVDVLGSLLQPVRDAQAVGARDHRGKVRPVDEPVRAARHHARLTPGRALPRGVPEFVAAAGQRLQPAHEQRVVRPGREVRVAAARSRRDRRPRAHRRARAVRRLPACRPPQARESRLI